MAAAVIGNVLEWYDFAVYAYLATVIAKLFFPTGDEVSALLATFATFGVGFVLRPLGAIVIGRLGDRNGRKAALSITIGLMALGTLLIGLAPTYASWGAGATAVVVVARLIQGFSAGGEWGSATAFMVEWAPEGRRGFYGSLQQCSVAGGLLLGAATSALISSLLSEAALMDWGWRVPFLLGALIGPVGWYLRRHIDDTPVFRAQAASPRPALSAALVAQAFGFTVLWTVSYYIVLTFLPTFFQQHVQLTRTQALWSTATALLLLVIVSPLFGHWSDRIGRKPLLMAACVAFMVLPYPLLNLMTAQSSLVLAMACQALLTLAIASFSGPGPAAIAEIFPTASRATGMSVGYSVAVAVFGGFSPFIATWLIAKTGSASAPAWYLMGAAMVTLVTLWRLPESAYRQLESDGA